jgi:hypothetical protein
VVGIRRAPIGGPVLAEVRQAIEKLAAQHADGLVFMTAFRLSPRFPLKPGFDSNTRELADHLRFLDRTLAASANVYEFGGVRAAAMRVATLAVMRLARPRAPIESFDRLVDGLAWLLPYARRVGALEDAAAYIALYQEADRALARMDDDALHVPPR